MTTGSLYLDSIKSGAIRGWIEEHIPASLTGAQAALESGWGTSSLARAPYNNQFGIKASSDWTGRVVNMPTKEYLNGAWVAVNADFRAYDDINDSVADHAKFFTSTEWRKNNYKAVIGETDYKKACYAVKAAGYATDPDYASKLINIIEKYKLYEWDNEAQSGTIPPTSDDVEVVPNLQPKSKVVGGDLSEAGRAFGKKTGVSVIGDSLGVGTEPHLVKLIPNSNYDVKGSRQITHTDSTLNGTIALQNMKNAGNLKQNVVVILGTNRGLTASEIDNFMNICGPERKVLWVETASAVKHNLSANEEMRKAATRHKNAFVLGWYDMVGGLRKEYYAEDDIHMTYMGYFNHAKAIVQGVYEMSTGDFDSSVAQTTTMQFEGIKGFKLSEDGKLEYTDENKVKQVIQTEFRGLSTDGKTNYIYNVSANNAYNPQTGATEADWLEGRFESSDLKGLDLFMAACRDMMNRGEPEATYRVVLSELPKGIEIGAEGTIVDTASNPPRYITARISEITTSQTNPEYNEVVITNVVEVKPFEKPTTLLIQEELRKNRDKLNTDYKERILESDLNSMGGLVLATEDSETTLIADVEVDGEDVTEHYSDFRWERQSNNAESDKHYNEILSQTENGMTLNVSDKDIEGEDSMFICRIYDDAGNLVRTIMKKMVSQVKIKKEIDTVLDRFDTERTETEQAINEALDSAKAEAERLDEERQQIIEGKFEVVNKANEKLEQSITDAEQKAKDALTKAGASEDLAKTAKEASDNALSQFQTTSADLSEAKATAEETLQNALSALNNANSVVTQSQTLLDNAESAKTEATNALLEAQRQLEASGVISGNLTTFKNEVNNTIKGYVTKATYDSNNQTLNTRMTEWEKTADGITTSISEVEGKVDNLQVGGRNLIKQTNQSGKLPTVNSVATERVSVQSDESGVLTFTLLALYDPYYRPIYSLTPNDDIKTGAKYTISGKIYVPTGSNNSVFIRPLQYVGSSWISGKFYTSNIINPEKKDEWVDFYSVFEWNNESASRLILSIDTYGDTIGHSHKIKDLKLEKGNKATDWTPAPEDLVSQSEYSIYKNETQETIDGFTRTVSAYEQDVTGYKNQVAVFNQTVDGYKSEVAKQTQSVNGLTTEVANYKQAVDGYSAELSKNTTATNGYKTEVAGYKQTVDGYGNKLSQYTQSNNTLTAKVNEYEATVDGYSQSLTRVEGKVDNLQVGGRNLLRDSNTPIKNSKYPIAIYNLAIKPIVGETYTCTIKGKLGEGKSYFGLWNSGGAVSLGAMTHMGDGYYRYTFKWVEKQGANSADSSNVHVYPVSSTVSSESSIEWIKLEKGNKATDWSPAPEDLVGQSEYTTYKNQVKSTTDEHTRRLTALDGTGGRVSKVEQTATQIQTSLSSYAKTSYVDTQITNKAGEITTQLTSLKGDFDNLQIGGRNYFIDYNGEEKNVSISTQNESYVYPSNNNSYKYIELEPNTTYTMSAWFRTDVETSRSLDMFFVHTPVNGAVQHRFNSYNLTTEYRKYTFTFITGDNPSQRGHGRFDINGNSETNTVTMFMKLAKLEKGNIATDWTPAPEDMFTKTEFQTVKETVNLYERTIGTTETNIKSNIAKITMTDSLFQTEVSKNTDVTNTKSKVTQLSDSWALTLKSGNDIKTAINATTDGIRLKGNLITLDGQVNMTSSFIVPEGNIGNLSAKKITSGTIDTARLNATDIVTKGLTSDVVKSEHILANEALFTKLFTNDLATEKLATKQAWIKSGMIGEAQIGTAHIGQIDASKINTGILTSTNGATSFDLNTGALDFYTDYPAIRRVSSGQPNQFVQFGFDDVYSNDGTAIVRSSSTAIGSNRWNNDVTTDGGFVGMRIFNSMQTPYVDRLQIIADLTEFTSSGNKTDYQNNVWFNMAQTKYATTQVYPSYHTGEGKSTLGRVGNPWTNVYTDDVTLNGVSLKAIVNRLYNAMGWGNIV